MPVDPKVAPRDLPPGDARREAMKSSADALAEEAAGRDEIAIDPARLEPDREVLYELLRHDVNQLDVTGAQPGYAYCWVRGWNEAGAAWDTQVNEKLGHRVRNRQTGDIVPVWEFVSRDSDPEAKGADVGLTPYGSHTRRIGDVLLMRCRRDVKDMLEAAEQDARDEREGRQVDDFARQARDVPGLRVHRFDGMSPTQFAEARRASVKRDVMNGPVTRALKEGRMPGLPPAPGR